MYEEIVPTLRLLETVTPQPERTELVLMLQHVIPKRQAELTLILCWHDDIIRLGIIFQKFKYLKRMQIRFMPREDFSTDLVTLMEMLPTSIRYHFVFYFNHAVGAAIFEVTQFLAKFPHATMAIHDYGVEPSYQDLKLMFESSQHYKTVTYDTSDVTRLVGTDVFPCVTEISVSHSEDKQTLNFFTLFPRLCCLKLSSSATFALPEDVEWPRQLKSLRLMVPSVFHHESASITPILKSAITFLETLQVTISKRDCSEILQLIGERGMQIRNLHLFFKEFTVQDCRTFKKMLESLDHLERLVITGTLINCHDLMLARHVALRHVSVSEINCECGSNLMPHLKRLIPERLHISSFSVRNGKRIALQATLN
ncbi:hypothetical protein HDE_00492 [Halotydeus destructor]|nr:hypothetical protein HDE_00492 [Halotydeus destructor]